jgi:hypothetical protein
MNVTELPIESNIAEHLPGATKEGAKLVAISETDEPIKIVEAINTFVANPPKKKWFKRTDNWDLAMPIGSLWAEQMRRQFNWGWVNMIQHDHNDFKVLALFDSKRSVGIYPFHYVYGCLENKVYPTILLAFNMLIAGKIPEFEDHSYTNLMDGVQHIIPPR